MKTFTNFFRVIYTVIAILFFLLNHSQNSFSKDQIRRLPIKNIEVVGLYSIEKEELLELLALRVGNILDSQTLAIGIKRAFLKGIFENLVIESDKDFSHIIVKVEEKKIIEKVEILKNEFFSRSFILKNLQIKKGDRLNPIKINEGINLLLEQMKIRGFTSAKATYSIAPTKKNRCILLLEVAEGSPTIIEKIIIQPEPSENVKSIFDLKAGDIYDKTRLERLKERFINFHEKQGRIGSFLNYHFNNGVLTINFSIGKKLEIDFFGNELIDTTTLMKEIKIRDLREFNTDIIDELKARLLLLYHRSGFAFANIIPITSIEEDIITIGFYIFEGTKYTVKNILLTGVSLQEDRIKNILNLKVGNVYNREYIESDKENMKELYHSLGYIEAEVYEPDIKLEGEDVEIEFFIYEGHQVTVDRITFKNIQVFSNEYLMEKIPLKIGSPYNEIDIADSRRKILEIYHQEGFINAKVSVETSFIENKAEITFLIYEGDIFYFGKPVLIGNERTKSVVIKKELQHEESKPLNLNLILIEKQQLQRLGLFSEVQINLSDYTLNNKRDILYYFEEEDHGALEVGFGYGEYEKYRFFADLSHKNLWGMNRYGSLRTELSSLEKRLSFLYIMPWFLVRDMSLKSMFLLENRKEKSLDTKEILYRLRRTNFSFGIERVIDKNLKTDVFYDFSVVRTSDVKPDVILTKEDMGTLIISGLRPGIIYDTRDNPFEPTEGLLVGLSSKLVSRLFFGETDFVKVTFYGNKYIRLSERIVLAISLRSGLAKGFGKTRELPIVERFFLGGRTTVRGYAQDTLGPKGEDGNPTGGNAFLMGNLELRAYSKKGFGVVAFVDAGDVWQKSSQFNISDLKFTTGVGIRYKTPAGPLRIDYGHKLNRITGESKSEIHFSIGHAF